VRVCRFEASRSAANQESISSPTPTASKACSPTVPGVTAEERMDGHGRELVDEAA
jgi:hypothetical protein